MNNFIVCTVVFFILVVGTHCGPSGYPVHQVAMAFSKTPVPASVKANLDYMDGYNNFKLSSVLEVNLPFLDTIRDCNIFNDGVSKRYIQRTLKEGTRRKLSFSDIMSAQEELKDLLEEMLAKMKIQKSLSMQERQEVADKMWKKKIGKGMKNAGVTKPKQAKLLPVDFTFELVTNEHRQLIDRTGKQPPQVFAVTTLNAYFEGELVGTIRGEYGFSNERFKFLYFGTDLKATLMLHPKSPNNCVYTREVICVGRPVVNACNRHDIDAILKDEDYKCKEYGANVHYHQIGYKRSFDISELFDSEVEPLVLDHRKPNETNPVIRNAYIPVKIYVGHAPNTVSESESIPLSEVVPNFILLDELVGEDEETGIDYPEETDLNLLLPYKKTFYEFPVHRIIIYARTGDFLYYLVENSTERAINQTVVIDLDIDPEIFKEILHFIYQNKVARPENCKNLLLPSLELQVYTLFEKCLRIIKDSMTLEDAFDYLQFAEMNHIVLLRSVVMEFLRNNAQRMSTSEFIDLMHRLPTIEY